MGIHALERGIEVFGEEHALEQYITWRVRDLVFLAVENHTIYAMVTL